MKPLFCRDVLVVHRAPPVMRPTARGNICKVVCVQRSPMSEGLAQQMRTVMITRNALVAHAVLLTDGIVGISIALTAATTPPRIAVTI